MEVTDFEFTRNGGASMENDTLGDTHEEAINNQDKPRLTIEPKVLL